MKKLTDPDYTILFGSAKELLANELRHHNYSKIAIIVDENTRAKCLPLIHMIPELHEECIIEIPAGENHKNIKTCEKIWQKMMMSNLDRHSLVINLGGGVIGDMGGFCAATYMRGTDFIQIPTTLLAQVDASIGGKLAVDLEFVKNMVGLFQQPKCVIIDQAFLHTLPHQQIRSGYAEIVKHALIADEGLWRTLQGLKINANAFQEDLLFRSVQIKKQVVDQDPTEKGLRKILNFGHTVGHGVETHAWKTGVELLHGEAIFVGMICEANIAYAKGLITASYLEEIVQFIKPIFYQAKAVNNAQKIYEYMLKDKKNRRDSIRMSLIDGKASCAFDVPVSQEEVLQSFSYYQHL